MKKATTSRPLATLILGAASFVLGACAQTATTIAPAGQKSTAKSSKGTRARKSPPPSTPSPPPQSRGGAGPYGAPVRLGDIEDPAVNESSGLVASRLNPALLWTHNDSGDGPLLYALDREGRRRGVWRVREAQARDWEDIAVGPGPVPRRSYLYVGDIGDNSERREEIIVYRVAEPSVAADDASSSKARPRATERAEAIRLKYPDGRHDAEALMVHPASGDLYVVTKTTAASAVVYKAAAPLDAAKVTTLTRAGEVRVPSLLGGMITGGDISPDGRRVVLCDYFSGYELRLPDGAASFDAIWGQAPATIDLGARQQGEAVCYGLDGRSILATSEKRPAPLI
ncbi:MAG: hypothetical protein ACRD68_18370, partial [Pyrinomonadaceae bacterium]